MLRSHGNSDDDVTIFSLPVSYWERFQRRSPLSHTQVTVTAEFPAVNGTLILLQMNREISIL